MKQNLFRLAGVIIIILFTLNGCKKDDPEPDPVVQLLSPGKQITSFKIVTPAATGVIDTTNKTIAIAVPAATDVTSLVTDISIAASHTISPASGVAQNFTNPVTYTVKRPNNETTIWTVTVTVASSSITVDQDITQSITWTSDKVYVINSEVEINNNSVLTIQPGTVIKFGANGSLAVGYSSNATIIANGTATNPITFTSSALLPTAGAWKGLVFYDNTLSSSSLAYCNIEYAGSNSNYGALNLLGCDMAINNCKITNSGTAGIHTTYSDGKGGFVTFDNNTISSTVKFGLEIHAQKVSTIGTGNVFTNTKGVSIFGDYNSTTAQTWKNLSAPYVIAEELDIDGNLTIEPGTTFKFEANGWIEIGYFAVTTFIADGTAAAPITFTSNTASPVAGAWKGIVVYDNAQANTKMNYCVIEYAGSTAINRGALHMSGTASIIFTNNIIRNSSSYGIDLAGDAGFEAFTNNTITNCANHVIVISTEHLPDLGSPNTLTAATGKGILVSGDINYDAPVTWKKQSADFYISGGSTDVDGMVTIEAGSRFLFVNDSYFWFGYYTNTRITAVGTSTNKIVFTTASSSPAAGTWKGLYFDDYVQTNSELAYCQFQYSGMNGKPALYVNTSFPVGNTSITNFSSTNAAEYKTGITVPAGTGNDFTWFEN